MIALILGGAPSVWEEFRAAQALIGDRPSIVVAANLAGIYAAPLDAWVSLHHDRLAGWMAERFGPVDYRVFVPNAGSGVRQAEILRERWPGSSGLFAVQAALGPMGAAKAILCGVPMDQDAGHFVHGGPWARTTSYRLAFLAARQALGDRIRSMGGWTRETFGAPDAAWVDGIATPARPSQPQPTRLPMYEVKNVSETTQKVQVRDPAGGFVIVHLKPGQSGAYDVDANQARYQPGGPLTAKLIKEAKAPKAAAKSVARKPQRKTAKPKPPTPAEPVSEA